ncbi:hypothetical protein [Ciceribacter azotifigens]|uniref:hypothetical protein n=1 Tax=Ciceribacter azotifigens TaxID=2069303 RepID=UPI003A84D4B8
MTMHFGSMIVPAEFPELGALVWNRDPARPMPARDVFSLYERNWRFVNREHLTDRERLLIDELTEEFGNGRMLTA